MKSSWLEALIVFKEDELMSRTALSNRNIMEAPGNFTFFSHRIKKSEVKLITYFLELNMFTTFSFNM